MWSRCHAISNVLDGGSILWGTAVLRVPAAVVGWSNSILAQPLLTYTDIVNSCLWTECIHFVTEITGRVPHKMVTPAHKDWCTFTFSMKGLIFIKCNTKPKTIWKKANRTLSLERFKGRESKDKNITGQSHAYYYYYYKLRMSDYNISNVGEKRIRANAIPKSKKTKSRPAETLCPSNN